jgi:hypothetical protein
MLFLSSGLLSTGVANAVDTGTVTSYYEGQAYVGDSPLVTTDAVEATDAYLRGFRYSSTGALRVSVGGTPASFCEGIALTATGQVCVGSDTIDTGDVAYLSGGLAVEESGLIYMVSL